ncbi:hypothetical protein PBI_MALAGASYROSE_56 [Mycobacterium phage MalagasyRose]|uniref:Lipoprotein n=1 Tax=Mycobacterium phage MalagasyRose TaxID=2599870 RepID=A0A5J6TEY9_9CAUD|nr:hypothetical protein QEH39_gp32 [Mycobacterium phage MalagasyRose]QFG08904.1 hypothetical protein PBI_MALAGASYROSE_56 [Mycobacterium phage MalagasyRose]
MNVLIKAAVVAVAATAALTTAGCSTMNRQDYSACTVIAKDMLLGSNSDGGVTRTKRLTTSCGSFDVGDSLTGGFNSWDTWAKLEVGKSYDLSTGGYRIGFFDAFPTVLSVTPSN